MLTALTARLGRDARSRPADSAHRAVFVVPDYAPATGGTASQTRLQATELARRGWRVTVLTRRGSRRWPRTEERDGVRLIRIGPPSSDPLRHGVALLGVLAWLAGPGRAAGVVQVVMDGDSAAVAVLAGLGPRTTMMWATAGDASALLRGAGRLAALRRGGLRRCGHVVLTDEMRREVTTLGLPPPAVIPVPVDASRFHPPSPAERQAARARAGVPAERFVVAFTGHLVRRKGVDLLLAAFAGLVAAGVDAHLLLAGAGEGRPDDLTGWAHRFVVDHDLLERVTFAGAVADVVPWLQAADVFCLPSRREGLPNSLLEAMACGLACVAPDSAGGAVLAGGAGIVPPSNSPEDLQAALEALAADAVLRFHLGAEAAGRVERDHDVRLIVDAYARTWAGQ